MSSVYFSTEVCAVPSQNIIPETRTEGSEGMGIDNVNGKQKKTPNKTKKTSVSGSQVSEKKAAVAIFPLPTKYS